MPQAILVHSEENTPQKGLVKQTAYENLLVRVETEVTSRERVFWQYRKTAKRILSVYFYLRTAHNMPRWPLSLEELLDAEKKLREVAEGALQNRTVFGRLFNTERAWNFYLTNGFFKKNHTPFGNTYSYYGAWHYDWDSFEPTGLTEDHSSLLPPNFFQLVVDCYIATYGKEEYYALQNHSPFLREEKAAQR
ncbi:MAG: hypothetical protein A2676_02205 [Candidatus Sungbacteria bacterium RIFCSPHIGHO2_01_FULL_51_22]|nr:MAG: hypothetical protein A2676_02205 [Candidatus Sungbacteria bacterium RIFCSPHIGHO2_01_FULL_51_22]